MATTVYTTFSVLKDHVKLKAAQDNAAIDNIGNFFSLFLIYLFSYVHYLGYGVILLYGLRGHVIEDRFKDLWFFFYYKFYGLILVIQAGL